MSTNSQNILLRVSIGLCISKLGYFSLILFSTSSLIATAFAPPILCTKLDIASRTEP